MSTRKISSSIQELKKNVNSYIKLFVLPYKKFKCKIIALKISQEYFHFNVILSYCMALFDFFKSKNLFLFQSELVWHQWFKFANYEKKRHPSEECFTLEAVQPVKEFVGIGLATASQNGSSTKWTAR